MYEDQGDVLAIFDQVATNVGVDRKILKSKACILFL